MSDEKEEEEEEEEEEEDKRQKTGIQRVLTLRSATKGGGDMIMPTASGWEMA